MCIRDRLNTERGTTVVLTTHDMQDIEALTERVLLIGRGQILLDGRLGDLKKQIFGKKIMEIVYQGPLPALHEKMTHVESHPERLTVSFDPEAFPVPAAIAWFAANTELLDVSVTDLSTEELVAALYKEYRL